MIYESRDIEKRAFNQRVLVAPRVCSEHKQCLIQKEFLKIGIC
jgi:hypothetical protein